MLPGSEILQLLVVKRWGEAGGRREACLGRRDWRDWVPVPTGDGPRLWEKMLGLEEASAGTQGYSLPEGRA